MSPAVKASELSPEVRKQLKSKGLDLRKPRQTQFSKEHVRRHALRVLAEIAQLSQDERRRVLEHALQVNAV